MDSPNISIRIRRHESLPCPSLQRTYIHPSVAKVTDGQRNNRTCGTASVLIGRRLGATKNNPYVGSFRHAPPTSLRSMAASSLPSLFSREAIASSSFSSVFCSPSSAFAANSPYVGWFRHAPPVFSSFQILGSATVMNNTKNKRNQAGEKKPSTKSSVVQHKIHLNSLLKLDRWHHQLKPLLLGISNEETEKNPPLILRRIVNGRLLGGSGEDDRCVGVSRSHNQNSIIHQCNSIYQSNTSNMSPLSGSEMMSFTGYKNTVLSRFTSWLLFPFIYADDECFDDYGCLDGEYGNQKTSSGLKYLLSKPTDSIEIDLDENDEDDSSSTSTSIDYDPIGESSIPDGVSPDTEREFSEEANLSVSEIAEAYYAHQLLDERRHRSNSNASQQSGLSSPSSLHHTTDYSREEETRQRLDYEITQMDIARMTRNASRHLDVESILKLPTIIYRKQPSSPNTCRTNQGKPQYQCEQSYHHICTSIREDHSDSSTQGSLINVEDTGNEDLILSEDGWSFMMVSGVKSSTIDNSVNQRKSCFGSSGNNDQDVTQSTDDMCVICQEPFRDGDRLRVLPCNHSFHVGCIDRWLTGSHSHNECFTTGCPVCKKQPAIQSPASSIQIPTLKASDTENNDMSGSLPSWAFTNLGNVLAMSSGDISGAN